MSGLTVPESAHVAIGTRVSYYGTQNYYQGEYKVVGRERPSHSPDLYRGGVAYVLRKSDAAPGESRTFLHDVRRDTFDIKGILSCVN